MGYLENQLKESEVTQKGVQMEQGVDESTMTL